MLHSDGAYLTIQELMTWIQSMVNVDDVHMFTILLVGAWDMLMDAVTTFEVTILIGYRRTCANLRQLLN